MNTSQVQPRIHLQADDSANRLFSGSAQVARRQSDCRRSDRRGFTLVELLITMLVIAILASIFLGALSEAEESARVARTQSLVNKLHNIVMARWDNYRTIRLPIALDSKTIGGTQALFDSSTDIVRFRQNVARRKMFALRELVRLEMPDRYDDIDPSHFNQVVLVQTAPNEPPVRTAVWYAYQRRLASAKAARTNTKNLSIPQYVERIGATNESAECLYLMVTTNIDSSEVSTEHVLPQDWGDTDQDGMPEFLDAWGKPIEFLRWAPAVESPLQPLYRFPTNIESDKRWKIFNQNQPKGPDDTSKLISRWNVSIDKVVDNAAANVTNSGATRTLIDRTVIVPQDDPFNPMRVGSTPDMASQGTGWQRSSRWRPGDPPPENGYVLYPFIYSGGPDQRTGIVQALRREGYQLDSTPSDGYPGRAGGVRESDPYAIYRNAEGARFQRGAPTGDGTDQDNITNHRIGTN